jgi:hypothetical protein
MPRQQSTALRESPAVPANIDDWTRYIKAERTINDLVEDIHRVLVPESADYRALLRAVYDGHAVHGSLVVDDVLAAQMVHAKAIELGTELGTEKLGPIKHALNIVLRRYKMSRKQRRNMVEGQIVPSDENNDGE